MSGGPSGLGEHAPAETGAVTCPSAAKVEGGWALFADHGSKLGYIGLGLVTEHAMLEVRKAPASIYVYIYISIHLD